MSQPHFKKRKKNVNDVIEPTRLKVDFILIK
jgi:hypothetical protein